MKELLFEIEWFFKHRKYRLWRIFPKLIKEYKYAQCKFKGHKYPISYKTCERCGYNSHSWDFAGDRHWLTGFQVDDNRWIK